MVFGKKFLIKKCNNNFIFFFSTKKLLTHAWTCSTEHDLWDQLRSRGMDLTEANSLPASVLYQLIHNMFVQLEQTSLKLAYDVKLVPG